MRNVTITLDDETARWARVEAARNDMSVSKLIRQLLEEKMREDERYERAMQDFLAEKPRALKKSDERYPRRDELYDRGRLR